MQRIWFGKNGSNVPSVKKFINDVQDGTVPVTLWLREEVGDNQEGKQELKKIFSDSSTPFQTPKPVRLLEKILQIATDPNSIILDSFAGSGTTAHAVLSLNKQDGGNRKFILIEMEDYAETITSERVKRVINGYSTTEGIGGSFDYYELGQPMFLEDGNLNESVGVEKIRQYVYYTETKQSLSESGFSGLEDEQDFNNSANLVNPDSDSFLGKHNDTGYYFYYEPDRLTSLTHSFLATMKTKAEQYVIYADNCLLTKDFLAKHHLIFKKIPRDITRF